MSVASRWNEESSLPGEKSYRLRACTAECHSATSQKDHAMEAVEDSGTRLMYSAQNCPASGREGDHM